MLAAIRSRGLVATRYRASHSAGYCRWRGWKTTMSAAPYVTLMSVATPSDQPLLPISQ